MAAWRNNGIIAKSVTLKINHQRRQRIEKYGGGLKASKKRHRKLGENGVSKMAASGGI
jgi:hypothetical protein